MVGIVILCLLVIAAGMMIYLSIISNGKIREYKDEEGITLEGSISE